MQMVGNSGALAMEVRPICIKPSISEDSTRHQLIPITKIK